LYSGGKQTYSQLATQFGCSTKTIQRRLDKVLIVPRKEFSSVAVVIMDTTYLGRGFGVMVFKNSIDGIVLYKQYVRYETNALYLAGISEISRRGIYIQGIVCDGRQGLFGLFGDIPVQMLALGASTRVPVSPDTNNTALFDPKTKDTPGSRNEKTHTKTDKTNKN